MVARHDLTAGKVRSITFADHGDLRFFNLTSGRFGSTDVGPVVLWREGAVDYRVANPRNSPAFSRGDGRAYPVESRLRPQISRAAGARLVPVHSGPRDLLLRYPRVDLPVFLLLLVVLFRAGQPRTATRWATFWLLLAPLNLGMLRTLVREAPWSAEMRAWPEPPPHRMMPLDRRLTGGHAFLQLLLCYFVVAVAVALLSPLHW